MSAVLTILAIGADACLWGWGLFNSTVNVIMGFAGFPEHQDDDEITVPTWLGVTVWFIAVGGLLASVTWMAIIQG